MSYIEMRDITKVYPNGFVANKNINLSIEKGEIHAIAGENGAGKSTIMKILYGAEKADGRIFLDGKEVNITSPRVANSLGIGMVYQHFMLINQFTACENIFFGIEKTNFLGVLKKKAMMQEAKELCLKYNMQVDLNERCENMSVSTLQKVEILKVLARGANIIILDEPTAVLTPQETEQLFIQLRLLRDSGYTIIIITHKLKEIKQLCDRITIMRLGETMGTYNVADVTESDISRLMVGREIGVAMEKNPSVIGKKMLEVKNLTIGGKGGKNAVENISFVAREGEILCVAGVEGNGQREVVEVITGTNKKYKGDILFDGENIKKLNIRKIRQRGLAHIPEDRLRTGCDANATMFDNLISLDYRKNSVAGFLRTRKLLKRGNEQIKKYGIKGSINNKLFMLSGGNMQKVIVARELESNPKLIVADQPTRGVDIGAIESIHAELVKMRDQGKAIVVISADLAEVFRLADRIIVFHEGKITANIRDVNTVDEMQLGKYMLGVEKMNIEEVENE